MLIDETAAVTCRWCGSGKDDIADPFWRGVWGAGVDAELLRGESAGKMRQFVPSTATLPYSTPEID